MMSILALCLLALTASVASHGLGHAGLVHAPVHIDNHRPYAYNYNVRDPSTGDNKAQWEHREGGVVRGAYSLAEPGGGIRTIEYVADPVSGFNYVFHRSGLKYHPLTLRHGGHGHGPVVGHGHHGVAVSETNVAM